MFLNQPSNQNQNANANLFNQNPNTNNPINNSNVGGGGSLWANAGQQKLYPNEQQMQNNTIWGKIQNNLPQNPQFSWGLSNNNSNNQNSIFATSTGHPAGINPSMMQPRK
jgi:hypothetical protein